MKAGFKPAAHAGELATIGDGIDVRASSIRAAGNGLYAARAFARGDLITEARPRARGGPCLRGAAAQTARRRRDPGRPPRPRPR